MDKLTTEMVGLVAVLIGLASLVPQLAKTWRTRSAGDLSELCRRTPAATRAPPHPDPEKLLPSQVAQPDHDNGHFSTAVLYRVLIATPVPPSGPMPPDASW